MLAKGQGFVVWRVNGDSRGTLPVEVTKLFERLPV